MLPQHRLVIVIVAGMRPDVDMTAAAEVLHAEFGIGPNDMPVRPFFHEDFLVSYEHPRYSSTNGGLWTCILELVRPVTLAMAVTGACAGDWRYHAFPGPRGTCPLLPAASPQSGTSLTKVWRPLCKVELPNPCWDTRPC